MMNAECRMKHGNAGAAPTRCAAPRSPFSIQHSSFSIPRSEEAEACFLKAIEIARKQQARSLELRAVMSLCRLWQRQSKHHAARNMLSEIYGWFTEGLETVDLQEAKALLAQLTL